MRSIQVSLDGHVQQHTTLTERRTVIGRRPDAHIRIENPSVSGHHAAITLNDQGQAVLEDLDSTNGTLFNGLPVRRRILEPGDVFNIGRYRLRYDSDEAAPRGAPGADAVPEPVGLDAVRPVTFAAPTMLNLDLTEGPVSLQVLNGPAAGRMLQLSKPVTSLGKAGVSVAAIERHSGYYVLVHREGDLPTVNGLPVSEQAYVLSDGDLIEIAGSQVRFLRGSP